MPCEMALRVVSLPATASSTMKKPNSSSVRPRPSPSDAETSAVTSRVMMSSWGFLRRSSASAIE